MDKIIAVVLALIVTVMTAMVVLSMISDRVDNSQTVTRGQVDQGCQYQKEHATDNSQISNECLYALDESDQNQQLFQRAGIPTID